ncbi:tyrosine-type recombinase/integrase [bacterium]|nr:tyrosine-type recombinase/integrase [bacterium]
MTVEPIEATDIDAEVAVLGAALQNEVALADVMEILRAEDFYREDHRLIFAAMIELTKKGYPVDVISVGAQLEEPGRLRAVDGVSAISRLTDHVPDVANAKHYATLVRKEEEDLMARRGRGEGTITHRKDGRWEAKMSLPNGTRRCFYGRTRSEAERKLRDAQKARDEYLPIPGGKLTVEMFLRSWLRLKKHAGLAPTTYDFYRRTVELHLVPALGKIPLVKLSSETLDELYAAKLDGGLSQTTVHHIHSVLRTALKSAVKKKKVAHNAAELADAPPVAVKGHRCLAWEEVYRLFKAAEGDRLEAVYIIAATTGMREGEILGLRWSDVDLHAGILRITGNLQRISGDAIPLPHTIMLTDRFIIQKPKTKQSCRQVRIFPKALEALQVHKDRQQKERERAGDLWHDFNLVFPNQVGGPIEATNFLKRSFRPLLKMAGLPPITFHDLRHTCATLLLEEGTHATIVSGLLGHARTSTTLDIYGHVAPSLTDEIPLLMTSRLDRIENELSSELSSNRQNHSVDANAPISKSSVN